jgi:hypothetical protein
MTIRYIDEQALVNSATYDLVSRTTGSGSDNCYATLGDAYADAVDGVDEIRWREGDYAEATNTIITKALSIGPYGDETVTLTANTGATQFLTLNAAVIVDIGANDFTLIGGTGVSASDNMVWFREPAVSIVSGGGKLYLKSPAGNLVRGPLSGAGTVSLSNLKLGTSTSMCYSSQASALILDGVEIVDGASLEIRSISTDLALVLNDPVCLYTINGPYINNLSTSSTVVVNDPYFIGCSAGTTNASAEIENSNATAGSISINKVSKESPIVQPCVTNRQGWITYGGNIVLGAGVKTTEAVSGLGEGEGKMSLMFFDSSMATDGHTAGYITASQNNGNAPLSYYPDDALNLGVVSALTDGCQDWVDAGLELGTAGLSGTDDWSETTLPFYFEYTGAGVGEIVVSASGTQWEVFENRLSVVVYNTDAGESEEFLNKFTTGVLRKIDALANWSVLPSDLGTLANAGWDDTYTTIITTNGTYTAPATMGPLAPEMPINSQVRFDLDIDGARALHGQHLSEEPKSILFYASGNTELTEYHGYAQAAGYTSTVSQYTNNGVIPLRQPIGSDAIKYQRSFKLEDTNNLFKGDVAAYNLLSAAQKEAQIRESMDVLSTYCKAIGGYFPIQFTHFPTGGAIFTGDEIDWMLSQGISNGISFVTLSEITAAGGTLVAFNDAMYAHMKGLSVDGSTSDMRAELLASLPYRTNDDLHGYLYGLGYRGSLTDMRYAAIKAGDLTL